MVMTAHYLVTFNYICRAMRYVTALTIAGSDSSGGAGIQADIKTMSALGVYAAAVITAVTAQNTMGVTLVEAVSPEAVAAQIDAVMSDIKPAAVKIGMVNDAPTVTAIADALLRYDARHIVVDPVMVATSGSRLMSSDAVQAFVDRLMPIATVLTPNIPEAEVLAGTDITDEATCDAAGEALSRQCKAYVLIKGGHLDEGRQGKCDRLYRNGHKIMTLRSESIDTRNTHGTGCTLSSAITACLACGYDIAAAMRKAKDYLTEALRGGADIETGHGHGPVKHFKHMITCHAGCTDMSALHRRSICRSAVARLQFISHKNGRYGYAEGVRMAVEGGCRWVQLRMKDADEDEISAVAAELLPLCRRHGVIFIIDDHVELALRLGADGVHLGRNDMPVDMARAMADGRRRTAGAQDVPFIIGGTANTIDDIRRLNEQGADYIGCGPFRFTTTKEGLAPVLGLDGYRSIIDDMRAMGITLPVTAIGGITRDDIAGLLATGVSGIAMSGAILNAPDPSDEVKRILYEMDRHNISR